MLDTLTSALAKYVYQHGNDTFLLSDKVLNVITIFRDVTYSSTNETNEQILANLFIFFLLNFSKSFYFLADPKCCQPVLSQI